jgi:protein-glutamine gamma-glutamyltransferase
VIRIAYTPIDLDKLAPQWKLDNIGRLILLRMSESERIYYFENVQQLYFEIILRANIVKEAYELKRTSAVFATFARSRCNPQCWVLTSNGGFLLKEGISPATAIRDIFRQGTYYAFECATAMIIVLYKAMLDTLSESTFNRLFKGLFLWDGHYDKNLLLESFHEDQFLPGDIRYFINPEVHPRVTEFQGENAVDLGNGSFYGHGIGITSARGIIDFLNRYRKPGAGQSAYITNYVLRPNFKRLVSLNGVGNLLFYRR